MKGRVRATVRVTLDIESDSVWGSDWKVEDISREAIDGVVTMLTQGNKLAIQTLPRRIVGKPEVVAVTVRPE